MNIPLEHLEEKFLATALKNGLSYWKKGLFEIIEDDATTIKARVYGTDEYLSELMFLNKHIVDVNCTCPNNRTLFCKHIAILYYEKLKDVLALKKAKPRKASKQISKSKVDQEFFSIETAVQNASLVQLKEIVVQELRKNADFKLALEHKLNPKHKAKQALYAFYKVQIQELLRKHKKQNFIDYSASNSVGQAVIDIASLASEHYKNHNLEASFEICKAILDTMIKPLNYTDTSSGIFYQGLDEALNLVLEISTKAELQPKLRKNMYTFFLKHLKDKKNHGWGYEINFTDILIALAENNKQKDELLKIIYNEDLDRHSMQVYNIIKKFDGEQAAKDFVMEHKTLPEFRSILFNEFMENKDYNAAKQCMYEGLKVNSEFRGAVINWIKNLLKIGELTEDKELTIKSAKLLFLNLGFRIYPDGADYYELLKHQFTAEEWANEWPLLIEKEKDKTTVEEIYFREGRLDLLFKSITKKQDFYFNSNYLNFNEAHIASLLPEYNEAFILFLKGRIVNYIDFYKGKKYYKEVCTTLIAFKKQGLDISGILMYLKENYRNRPSLMTRIQEYFE
ncbi:SWIM zinc finger domain-containing protein [Mariniflexile ostreae]|uniref:SWIM zinc finger domain-containing protein n=1 Tax=Mariniflexile ostreae TaxID=1520892 RepID=A0ABV5F7M3_9FLAO